MRGFSFRLEKRQLLEIVDGWCSTPSWKTLFLISTTNGTPPTKNTALHIAALRGNEELVSLFLKKGVDVNSRNYKGATPLFHAVSYGQTRIVKILLNAHADRNLKTESGSTPMSIAKDLDEKEIQALLKK